MVGVETATFAHQKICGRALRYATQSQPNGMFRGRLLDDVAAVDCAPDVIAIHFQRPARVDRQVPAQ